MSFRGCNIPNALNLEKLGVKIHNYVLLLEFLALFHYNTRMPLFSRISPTSSTKDGKGQSTIMKKKNYPH